MNQNEIRLEEALDAYFATVPSVAEPYGNGLINDTFLVVCENKRYILQRVNTSVFSRPVQLMENILGVTEHIRKKALSAGEDAVRATLTVLPTRSGAQYFTDSENGFWRLYAFVEGTVSIEQVQSKEQFYSCAKAFGRFQRMLADYPAKNLHEPIAGLHDTPARYEQLCSAAKRDVCHRALKVQAELAFAAEHADFYKVLDDAGLPLRVTHNDTKLNNILFDAESGDPVCVIDLDTVMPGYSVTDFGDSVRAGAVMVQDDEKIDLSLFEVFTRGFLEGCEGALIEKEVALLPEAALLITLELGMRFLADYLVGDTYFKTKYPGHNLDRARNQFALARDMEKKLPEMRAIVQKLQEELAV